MPALAAGPCIVRDFVRQQTLARRFLGGRLVQRDRDVVVGLDDGATLVQRRELGTRLDGELVERQMICRNGERLTEFQAPSLKRLARARVDQIE
jgi:hypothetical protein